MLCCVVMLSVFMCTYQHCLRCWLQVTDIIAEGYPAQQVLLQLQAAVVPGAPGVAPSNVPMSDKQRAGVCELLAESDKDLIDGADEFLQLLNIAGSVQQLLVSS
jgi:replication factor C subunit 2/4